MTLQVRPATPEEYDEIGALCVRAYLPSGQRTNQPLYAKLRECADRAESAVLLVALDAGRVVGSVTYCPQDSPYREIGQAGEGEFRMLAVDPDEQGRGIGKVLIRDCVDRAREEGCHAVVVSSAAWMRAAHYRLEEAGFVRTPERDWVLSAGVDLLTFRLELSDQGQ